MRELIKLIIYIFDPAEAIDFSEPGPGPVVAVVGLLIYCVLLDVGALLVIYLAYKKNDKPNLFVKTWTSLLQLHALVLNFPVSSLCITLIDG